MDDFEILLCDAPQVFTKVMQLSNGQLQHGRM
jgi:hypothetical protein